MTECRPLRWPRPVIQARSVGMPSPQMATACHTDQVCRNAVPSDGHGLSYRLGLSECRPLRWPRPVIQTRSVGMLSPQMATACHTDWVCRNAVPSDGHGLSYRLGLSECCPLRWPRPVIQTRSVGMPSPQMATACHTD